MGKQDADVRFCFALTPAPPLCLSSSDAALDARSDEERGRITQLQALLLIHPPITDFSVFIVTLCCRLWFPSPSPSPDFELRMIHFGVISGWNLGGCAVLCCVPSIHLSGYPEWPRLRAGWEEMRSRVLETSKQSKQRLAAWLPGMQVIM
jgi:hypothetical protein